MSFHSNPLLSAQRYVRRFGAHMSVSGGIYTAFQRAIDTTCNTMAVFSASPRVWQRVAVDAEMIDAYSHAEQNSDVRPVILHALYLANLASADGNLHQKSLDALSAELHFADQLRIKWVVLHPGYHKGWSLNQGIEAIASGLNVLFESDAGVAGIALETMSGGSESVGGRFEYLRDIISTCRYPDRLSVCLDTCHVFAAGYDIRDAEKWDSVITGFQHVIGLDKLTVIHLNDSRGALGSHLDRHTHIGEGQIGEDGFRAIVNDAQIQSVPMILETPKDPAGVYDRRNLKYLRNLLQKQNKSHC